MLESGSSSESDDFNTEHAIKLKEQDGPIYLKNHITNDVNQMLANYTENKDLSYTDQALLFGLTSRLKYSDENIALNERLEKP